MLKSEGIERTNDLSGMHGKEKETQWERNTTIKNEKVIWKLILQTSCVYAYFRVTAKLDVPNYVPTRNHKVSD